MSKTKKTMLLAIASMLNLGVSALANLFLGRLILVRLGSDYNGLNAIISQFLTVITLVEGGFTTASLVALFQPYSDDDVGQINMVLAESAYKFRKIGLYSSVFGLIFAAVYAAMIKTGISYFVVFTVLGIALVSTVFNLVYVTRFRILFQAAQDEHIFVFITAISNLLSRCAMILLLLWTDSIVLVRCAYCFFAIAAGVVAFGIFKRRYQFIDLTQKWDGVKRINGTRDVLVGRVLGVLYTSAPPLFLSVFANTLATSVYAVYTSIIGIVSSVVSIAISSPQNSLGRVLHENDDRRASYVMEEFEYFVILILTVLFAAIGIVLLPFISIYTEGVTDTQYIDVALAIILLLTNYFQLLHIPSGLCINMAGYFAVVRKTQLAALCVLLPSNIILGLWGGLYGILLANLICSILLAILEIGYVHTRIFPKSVKPFLKALIPNFFLACLLIAVLGPIATEWIGGYMSFFFVGCGSVLVASVATFLMNYLYMRKSLLAVCMRLLRVLRR